MISGSRAWLWGRRAASAQSGLVRAQQIPPAKGWARLAL